MNCCAMTDVAPSCRFRLIKYNVIDTTDEEDETIQYALMDMPSITFKIKTGNKKDSIYAWYQDHACFPSFKWIDEKGWDYGSPVKCFYWSNISAFTFFKSKADYSKDLNEFGIIEDIFPEDQEGYEHLGTIYVRLFDDEKFMITYDVKKKRIKLAYNKGK